MQFFQKINQTIEKGEKKVIQAMSRGRRALWWTIFVILGWMTWNYVLKSPYAFDPFPYVWLMGLITELSYLQNIVIMTDQETAAKYLVMMLESQAATGTVTLEHVRAAEQRDLLILDRLEKLEKHIHDFKFHSWSFGT